MLTWRQIKRDLNNVGIGTGARLMIHSSYKSLKPVRGGPKAVIKAFVKTVGPEGQLLFPTFNFGMWTVNRYFDAEKTRSEMGTLTETARLHRKFYRTLHPIYSFAEYPSQTFKLSRQAFETPGWRNFCKSGGVILCLGLKDIGNAWTIVHHAERLACLGDAYWREPKEWTGTYVADGLPFFLMKFGMSVRKPGVITDIRPAIAHLIRREVIKRGKVGPADLFYVRAATFVDEIKKIAQTNPQWLHKEEG